MSRSSAEKKNMTIGVVGLGLIGASLAAAFKEAGYKVLGDDKDRPTKDFALMAGTIDAILDKESIKECNMIFIAISVKQAMEWLSKNAESISSNAIVVDCCGVKRSICNLGSELSACHGFRFVGGHPMAGKQIGGYKNSRADLFGGATFCMVPQDNNDIRLITELKSVLKDAGFAKFMVMTAEEHDRVIAFTSQMAHLLSNAYIKSDMAEAKDAAMLSGGAFRDMTRVAYLDESMWTDLFLENKDNLLAELNSFITELEKYKLALEDSDKEKLSDLLLEGKNRKTEIENSK